MEPQKQLESEISELQQLINTGQQQGVPNHLLKMYQSLIKSKKAKLKQLIAFSNQADKYK